MAKVEVKRSLGYVVQFLAKDQRSINPEDDIEVKTRCDYDESAFLLTAGLKHKRLQCICYPSRVL